MQWYHPVSLWTESGTESFFLSLESISSSSSPSLELSMIGEYGSFVLKWQKVYTRLFYRRRRARWIFLILNLELNINLVSRVSLRMETPGTRLAEHWGDYLKWACLVWWFSGYQSVLKFLTFSIQGLWLFDVSCPPHYHHTKGSWSCSQSSGK